MSVTTEPRRPELAFRVKAGVAILWPFLGPIGVDTGNAATSYFYTDCYVNPARFPQHVGAWLSNVAARAGFDHVRLMVNPGPIIECNINNTPDRKAALLGQIEAAVDLILDAGLKCYIDIHLTGYVTGYSTQLYLDGVSGTRFARYKAMVLDFANHFAGHDPTRFALELCNEPPDEVLATWAAMQADLHAAVRAVMPRHTIITTAPGYSHAWRLTAFDPSGYDKNTLWMFHFYPLFGLQGYNLSDYTKWFSGADWEKRPDQRPAILAMVTERVNADGSISNKAAKISAVMANYDELLTQGRDYMESQVQAAVNWAESYGVEIICGEYGVTHDNPAFTGCKEPSRLAYMRDMTATLARYGVPRTIMAPDATDYHIPGSIDGAQTLDAFPDEWLRALMPEGGFGRGSGEVDLDFLTNSYAGGSLGTLRVTQAAALEEAEADGSSRSFVADQIRKTTAGVWFRGVSAEWIGANGKNAAAWAETKPGWVTAVRTPLSTDANGFTGIQYESNNNASGGIYGGLTETLAEADVVTIKVRAKDGAGTSGGLLLLMRAGSDVGTDAAGASVAIVAAGSLATTPNVTVLNADTDYVGFDQNADGTTDLIFRYTVPGGGGGAREFGINTVDTTAGRKIEVRGLQVVRGTADQLWRPVDTASVTVAADQVTAGPELARLLTAAAGSVVIEYQGLDYATTGTAGVDGSVAGALLKVGGVELLKPAGPTGFSVADGAATGAIGLGGNRGIVRLALAWDGDGWSACANGGKVITSGAPLSLSGEVGFFDGISGRLRRVTAAPGRMADADLQAWSDIVGRDLPNPGDALVPGRAERTFHDDFDADSLMTIASPAFPYAGAESMLDAYAASWASGGRWKPRLHNYTQNANGSFPNHSGQHELQHYVDPQVSGQYPVIEFADSCLKGYTQKTSNLTSGQQALVPENPDTPGVKAKYVSWLVSTASSGEQAGADTGGEGGFYQRFGIFTCRAKFPAHQGSWAAFWLYRWGDTSELDCLEYYGYDSSSAGPTRPTWAAHADNFAWNMSVPPGGPQEMGCDMSQDQHEYAVIWRAGSLELYIDGAKIAESGTGGTFDDQPKFLILNMAVQPDASGPPWDDAAPAPDASAEAAMPWVSEVDRVTVLQFI